MTRWLTRLISSITLIRRQRRPARVPYTTLFRSLTILLEVTLVSESTAERRLSETGAGERKRHQHLSRSVAARQRSEEHTSELQSRRDLVCRLLREKKRADDGRVWTGR